MARIKITQRGKELLEANRQKQLEDELVETCDGLNASSAELREITARLGLSYDPRR